MMARAKPRIDAGVSAWAAGRALIHVRVAPGAAHDHLRIDGERLKIGVTAPAVDGRATDAVARLLAQALGVAAGRVRLVRGATARDKQFVIESD